MIWGGLLRLALIVIAVLFQMTYCFDPLKISKRDINAGDISSLFNYIQNGTFSAPQSTSQQKELSDMVKFLGNCTVSLKRANQHGRLEGRNSLHDNVTISMNVEDLQGLKRIIETQMKESPLRDMFLTALDSVSNKSQNEENNGHNDINPSSNLTYNLLSALDKPDNSDYTDNQNKSLHFLNNYYNKIPNEENNDSYIYSFNLTFKDMATVASMLRNIWNDRSYQHIYKNEPENGLAIKDDNSFTGADLNKKDFIILQNANNSDVNYIANNLSLETSLTNNKTVVIPVTVDFNDIINRHKFSKTMKSNVQPNSNNEIDKILNGNYDVSEDRVSFYSSSSHLANNNISFLFAADNNDSFVSHPESKMATNQFQAESVTDVHLVPQVNSSYKNPLPGLLSQIGKLLPGHVLEGLMKKENHNESQTNPYREGWSFVHNGSLSNKHRSILNPEVKFPAIFSLQTSINRENVLSPFHLQKEITEPFVYAVVTVNASSNETNELADFISNDTIQNTTAVDIKSSSYDDHTTTIGLSHTSKTKTLTPVRVPLYVQNNSQFLSEQTVRNSTTSLKQSLSTRVILTTQPTVYLENTVSVFSNATTSSNSTVNPTSTILNETGSSFFNTINVTSVHFNINTFTTPISNSTIQYCNNTDKFNLSSFEEISSVESKPAMNVTPSNSVVLNESTRYVEDEKLYRRNQHVINETEDPDCDAFSLPALCVANQSTRMINDRSGQNLTDSTKEIPLRNIRTFDVLSKATGKTMFQALPTVVADSSTELNRDEYNKTVLNKTKRDESVHQVTERVHQVTERSQYYFNEDAADISVIDYSKIDVTEYTILKVKGKGTNTANFSLSASLQVDFNTTDHGKVGFKQLKLPRADFTERKCKTTSCNNKIEPSNEKNCTGKKNTTESIPGSNSDKYLQETGVKDVITQLLEAFNVSFQPIRQMTALDLGQPVKIKDLFYHSMYKNDQLSTTIYFLEKQALSRKNYKNNASNGSVKNEEPCNIRKCSELEYRESHPKLLQSDNNTDNYFSVNRISIQRNFTRLFSNTLRHIQTSVKNATRSYMKMNSSEHLYESRTVNSAITVKYLHDKISNKNCTIPNVQYNIYKVPIFEYLNATRKPALLVSTSKVELRNKATKFDYAVYDQLHRNISTKKLSFLTTPVYPKISDQNKQAIQINCSLNAPNCSYLNCSSLCNPIHTVAKPVSKSLFKENSTFVQNMTSLNNLLSQNLPATINTKDGDFNSQINKQTTMQIKDKLITSWPVNNSNNNFPAHIETTTEWRNYNISDHHVNTESALYTYTHKTTIPDKMNKYNSVNYKKYNISESTSTVKNMDIQNLHNKTSMPDDQFSLSSSNTSQQIPTNELYFVTADNDVNRNPPIDTTVVLNTPEFRLDKMNATENYTVINGSLFNNGTLYNSSTGLSETVDNNTNTTHHINHDLTPLQSMNQIRNTTASDDLTISKENSKSTTSSPYISVSDGGSSLTFYTVLPVEQTREFKGNDYHEFANQNKPEQTVDYTRTTEKIQTLSQNPISTKTFFVNLPLVTQFALTETHRNTKNFNKPSSERNR